MFDHIAYGQSKPVMFDYPCVQMTVQMRAYAKGRDQMLGQSLNTCDPRLV